MQPQKKNEVDLTSDASFPASDPPSWSVISGVGSNTHREVTPPEPKSNLKLLKCGYYEFFPIVRSMPQTMN